MADKHFISNPAEILDADDLVREEIEIAEWGGSVFVREFTAQEAADVGAIALDKSTNRDLLARVAAMVLVKDDGQPLFKPNEASKLARKSFKALRKISDTAQRLSGLTAEARDQLGKGSAGMSADDLVSA